MVEFTDEFLKERFNQYNEKYFNGKVPEVKLEWNNRFTSTAGRCWYNGEMEPYKIEISSKYVKMYPNEFKNIMIHEMIHVLYPEKEHVKFKEVAKRLNEEFEELNITLYNKEHYWRYKYQCLSCGNSFTTARKIHKNHVCGYCEGDLKIVLDNEK